MNRVRDTRNMEALAAQGWNVLELWECDIRRATGLEQVLRDFMAT